MRIEKLTPVCSVGNKDLADMMDAIFALRSDDKTVSSFPACFLPPDYAPFASLFKRELIMYFT